MVPKFGRKDGLSFKGLVQYLTHDANHAATDQRVAWTHTLNLAHDHVPSAIHEMYTTTLDADVLKAEAGFRAGDKVERPVKHVSLNWHPSETPDRKEMTRAAQSFLHHMGWQDHQAVLIAHSDTPHRHVHLVVNSIHPETGLKLDDGFERRRAHKWAAAYEAERGTIFCPQRQLQAAAREAAMPRPAWIAAREHVKAEQANEAERLGWDGSYLSREEARLVLERREWQILKDVQKGERQAFFAGGKGAYGALNRAVYRQVREEFRGEWADFYAGKRAGRGPAELVETKADLVARQKEVLDERRMAATTQLRASRDREYRALLTVQKEERGELLGRQEQNLRSPRLLDRAYPIPEKLPAPGIDAQRPDKSLSDALDRFSIRRGRGDDFADAARAQPGRNHDHSDERAPFASTSRFSARAPSRDFAVGLASGLFSFLGGIGDGLLDGPAKPAAKPRVPDSDGLDRFQIERGRTSDAERERAERAQHASDEAYWEWRKRKREMDR